MRHYLFALLLLVCLIAGAVRTETEVAFINASIITLDKNGRTAQAMLVIDGRIRKVGSTRQIRDGLKSGSRVVDLQGKTVIPGFVDAHSHFPASGLRAVSVDLSPPPIGNTNSVLQILDQIEAAVKTRTKNDWILGYNYDNTVLELGQHPTRSQLDKVAPDNPVYLWHNSGHMGVANSRALDRLSIDEDSPVPAGGSIGRNNQTGALNGLLQETAAPPLSEIVKNFSWRKKLAVLQAARDDYLQAGVTTVQNGYAGSSMMRALKFAQLSGLLPQRVVAWPAFNKGAAKHPAKVKHQKEFVYRVGAIKILVDGSPQGMTAYLSKPYFDTKDFPANYRGYPHIDQKTLNEIVSRYHQSGYQLALHGNGDEAIEFIINAVQLAQSNTPIPSSRHIIVHAQTIREDQIERLSALGLTPSFFISHTYYWGDWHSEHTLGPERANNISPAGWASDAGLRYSLHADTPVTPINPLLLIWSAATRQSLSGKLLGRHQRIGIKQALEAVTIDAAWQNHIDHDVGSLEEGKLADMVVLSQNPFEVNDVREIEVLQTYIGGELEYQHSDFK